METLLDKSLVLCVCVYLVLSSDAPAGAAEIVWLLIAVVASNLCELWGGSPGAGRAGPSTSDEGASGGGFPGAGRRALGVPAVYLAAGCLSAGALPGTPLAVYDLARVVTLRSWPMPLAAPAGEASACSGVSGAPAWASSGSGLPGAPGPSAWAALLCGAPLLAAVLRQVPGPGAVALTLAVCALSAVLAVRTAQEERVRDRLHTLRDDLHVRMVALQHANARLLEAQDHEVRAAALSERTRIARDIHDTVGHLLTRLTLRVKALQVLHRDEPDLVAELAELGSTLDEALGSVRSSVHALSDDGEDLAVALNRLAAGCGIEVVRVDCALQVQPPTEVSRCLVAVAREALTNAVRHGRASSASVAVTDFPGFWRVTVANDGVLPGRGTLGSPRLEPVEVDEDAMVAARPGRGPQRGPDAGGAGRGVLVPAGTEADGLGTGASGQAGLWPDGHWPDDPLRGERGSAGPWPYSAGGGLGLRSMAERVESLGGALRVLTRPRFTVVATVPRRTTVLTVLKGEGEKGA